MATRHSEEEGNSRQSDTGHRAEHTSMGGFRKILEKLEEERLQSERLTARVRNALRERQMSYSGGSSRLNQRT